MKSENTLLDEALSKATISRMGLVDQVRKAMNDSGLTRYRLSKLTGIDQGILSKFAHGTRGLSMENLDKLAEVLGLSVAVDPAKSPKAAGTREKPAPKRTKRSKK